MRVTVVALWKKGRKGQGSRRCCFSAWAPLLDRIKTLLDLL
jgi:hypothetical protein